MVSDLLLILYFQTMMTEYLQHSIPLLNEYYSALQYCRHFASDTDVCAIAIAQNHRAEKYVAHRRVEVTEQTKATASAAMAAATAAHVVALRRPRAKKITTTDRVHSLAGGLRSPGRRGGGVGAADRRNSTGARSELHVDAAVAAARTVRTS